jgi:HEAT repeat protein
MLMRAAGARALPGFGLNRSAEGTKLPLVKRRILRISIGVLMAAVILVGVIWVLSKTLGNARETLYAGQPLSRWQQQLDSRDVGASNRAYAVLNAQVIPQLIDTMFHDTNDSKIRLAVIGFLNGLPGIQITYFDALERRSGAVGGLGQLGPVAKAAVPSLVQVLKGSDRLHEDAIRALGNIHSDPEVVIPLLIPYLTNDDFNDKAAIALGNYGSLAKEAVPKIVPLLKARDKDDRYAARVALKQIDPEAAAKAGVK